MPVVGYAESIIDYMFRWPELKFITGEQGELLRPVQFRVNWQQIPQGEDPVSALAEMIQMGDAPGCNICGSRMTCSGTATDA